MSRSSRWAGRSKERTCCYRRGRRFSTTNWKTSSGAGIRDSARKLMRLRLSARLLDPPGCCCSPSCRKKLFFQPDGVVTMPRKRSGSGCRAFDNGSARTAATLVRIRSAASSFVPAAAAAHRSAASAAPRQAPFPQLGMHLFNDDEVPPRSPARFAVGLDESHLAPNAAVVLAANPAKCLDGSVSVSPFLRLSVNPSMFMPSRLVDRRRNRHVTRRASRVVRRSNCNSDESRRPEIAPPDLPRHRG